MVSKTTFFIERKLQELRDKNIKSVMKNPKLAKIKVANHIEKFGGKWNLNEILHKIATDEVVASFFCVDPAKQNQTETWVSELIKTNREVCDFKILPKSGNGSIRIGVDGNFIKDATKTINATKSIDFCFRIAEKEFYACQKFTRNSGGSQDNQFKDVVEFLKHGSRVIKKNTYFVAILDGDYFSKEKIDTLNTSFQNYRNVFATSADYFY